MFDKTAAGILSTLFSIRAKRQAGHYAPQDDATIEGVELTLVRKAPGFVTQLMRESLADCPMIVQPEFQSASAG